MVIFSLFAMMKASKKADMGYEVHLLKLSFVLMGISSIFLFAGSGNYALPVIIIGGILFFYRLFDYRAYNAFACFVVIG
jgi:hypothetical protein